MAERIKATFVYNIDGRNGAIIATASDEQSGLCITLSLDSMMTGIVKRNHDRPEGALAGLQLALVPWMDPDAKCEDQVVLQIDDPMLVPGETDA